MPTDLAAITRDAKGRYADLLASGQAPAHWWTALVITASSARQAERYEQEIARRRQSGQLPPGVRTLVVPDLDDRRLGSGGATINALYELAQQSPEAQQRVLLVHAGGDSRRLPQYSLSGKLFSALPVDTAWGAPSTLFDEVLALSTPWTDRLDAGVVVLSGDVLLTFGAAEVDWSDEGVSGVAMRQPFDVGSKHGVYVLDSAGRVYSFLQKPTLEEAESSGALLDEEQVALDTGLLYFSPDVAGRLTGLAPALRAAGPSYPVVDLYEHVTFSLTGQFHPSASDHPLLHDLAAAMHGVPFRCDLVDGEFTHVGTTRLFRHLMAEETNFSRLYEARQRTAAAPAGVHSAGVILDSVLTGGGDIASGAIVLECHLTMPVRASVGAILHGLTDLPKAVDIPPDTVVHQVPVRTDEGLQGTVLRVYGVGDDPKEPVGSGSWLGRPFGEALGELGITPEQVWRGVPEAERSLWNARLFPVTDPRTAWACARWQMSLADGFSAAGWAALPRLSLAESAQWADSQALAEARARRLEAQWETAAVALAEEDADIRPLLANAPALVPVASAGRALMRRGEHVLAAAPTAAASRFQQAQLLLIHAGLTDEAARARASAFASVRRAVDAAEYDDPFAAAPRQWGTEQVCVAAPARVDLGGGWSDTPPFCLDWGGTVLNLALLIDGEYPVRTTIRRLDEPLIRCLSADCADRFEYRTTEEVLVAPDPGSSSAIPRAALALTGLVRQGDDLADLLTSAGGGLEITTSVSLPLGSGL
ncbi:MAG: L-fucokinase, partial [Armatimonadia bacterium]